MKAYTYKPEQAGLNSWPSGELRLAGTVPTNNPAEAVVFICPGNLSLFSDGKGGLDHLRIYKLPYLKGNEARHVFLDISEHFRRACGMPCMFIRCDAQTWMLAEDPNIIPIAWPSEDFAECIQVPPGGFDYDVSFHGWLSSDARRQSYQSCMDTSSVKCDVAGYPNFYGYIEQTSEGKRRRVEYIRSLKQGRMSLCPESLAGVLPYRFFEAMSAARVPVLVGSQYLLPFRDKIPYDDFCLFIEASDARHTAERIAGFLNRFTDSDLIRMGLEARQYWEKYLDRRKWPELFTAAVEEKLCVLQ